MAQEHGNKLEAKRDSYKKTQQIEDFKIKQAETKNTIAEIKKFTSKETVTECRRHALGHAA